ncbi:hypothetical protein LPJ66_004183 [Kickxella alabastrina]|uniref:Uncharacterized protein n=1 Tax=Kickxella alabastrina TaxID=61397 RepID=A0ACC1ILW4_9FUNG|nr:hypothetical protein LPJ66_004183 [Kickxella alabastrina]
MSSSSSFRAASTWDPLLILAQITTLQCFAYTIFSLLLLFSTILTPLQLTPALLFDSALLRGDTVSGWTISLAFFLTSVINIIPLLYLVERSRLCIDFTLTFFIIHLGLVIWHSEKVPGMVLWWATVGGSAVVMAVGGRAACVRREMLPIAIRNYMPERPMERRRGADQEEYEMESRDTEVLFDATDAAGGDGDYEEEGGVVSPQRSNTVAGAGIGGDLPRRSAPPTTAATRSNANTSAHGKDKDWDNDNWSDDDNDNDDNDDNDNNDAQPTSTPTPTPTPTTLAKPKETLQSNKGSKSD